MLLFSCLTLGAILVLPRRDCTNGMIGGILFLLGATLLAYSTDNLLVLLAAWILFEVPFVIAGWFGARTWRPLVGLLLSSLALTLAIGLISVSTGIVSVASLKGQSPGGIAAFGLLVIAVIFRKGICPAQAWVADAAGTGPAIPTALLLNGHFGALLVAKLIVPLFPRTDQLFPILSCLAIFPPLLPDTLLSSTRTRTVHKHICRPLSNSELGRAASVESSLALFNWIAFRIPVFVKIVRQYEYAQVLEAHRLQGFEGGPNVRAFCKRTAATIDDHIRRASNSFGPFL